MRIFSDIKNSIYNPTYYSELLQKPSSYSIGYYFLFSLLLTIALTMIFTFSTVPAIHSVLKNAAPMISEAYPDELEITVKNGTVSTNVQEPYVIKTPDSLKKEEKLKDNMIIIDTVSNVGIDEFKRLDTYALITKTNIIVEEENGKITIQSLDGIDNFTLNENAIASFITKASPYLKLVYPAMFVIFLIGFFFMSIAHLAYLLLGALLIWAVASYKQMGIGYGTSYRLGMHLMTLPLILTWVPFLNLPFVFTILLVVMAAINLKTKAPATEMPSASALPDEKPTGDISTKTDAA